MALMQPLSTEIREVNVNYNILTILKEKTMKQTELANALGVDKSYVNRIVRGKQKPTNEIMIKIAQKLGVDSRIIFP